MNITCTTCKKEYDGRDALTERPAPDKGEDVTAILLICPHCQAEVHSHHVDPAIKRRQELVGITLAGYRRSPTDARLRRYRQAQEDLHRTFDALNPRKAKEGEDKGDQ